MSILCESLYILRLKFLRRNCAKEIVIRYYKNKFMVYENIIENYDIKNLINMALKTVFFLVSRFILLQNN